MVLKKRNMQIRHGSRKRRLDGHTVATLKKQKAKGDGTMLSTTTLIHSLLPAKSAPPKDQTLP